MTEDTVAEDAVTEGAAVTEGRPVVIDGARYAVRLPAFDGPLDLLLHLIRREQFDIFDIPISALTAAYLASLDDMRRAQMEPASDFLLMAATLLQIKSRMLLPRPPGLDDIEADAPEDPRDELVRQLLEYRRFREVALGLDAQVMLGRDVFYRPGGLDKPPAEDEDLAAHDAYRLGEAFRALIARTRFEAPHDIWVERISIGERIAQIADLLAETGSCTLSTLLGGVQHREEAITTFLALLEMARLKLIHTTQGEHLGELYIEARVGAIGDLGEEAAGMLAE